MINRNDKNGLHRSTRYRHKKAVFGVMVYDKSDKVRAET